MDELHKLMDRLKAELEQAGHTTADVEVSCWAYRWMTREDNLGPIPSGKLLSSNRPAKAKRGRK